MALGFKKTVIKDDLNEAFEAQFEAQGDAIDNDVAETPKELSSFIQPTSISLKEDGSSIEGFFQGLQFQEKGGFNNDGIWIAHFRTKDNQFNCCVLSYQIKEFLMNSNFPQGKYLRIVRDQTITTKNGQKLGIYRFEFDPDALKKANKYLPVSSLLNDKKQIAENGIQF